jgi:hypothetical protein
VCVRSTQNATQPLSQRRRDVLPSSDPCPQSSPTRSRGPYNGFFPTSSHFTLISTKQSAQIKRTNRSHGTCDALFCRMNYRCRDFPPATDQNFSLSPPVCLTYRAIAPCRVWPLAMVHDLLQYVLTSEFASTSRNSTAAASRSARITHTYGHQLCSRRLHTHEINKQTFERRDRLMPPPVPSHCPSYVHIRTNVKRVECTCAAWRSTGSDRERLEVPNPEVVSTKSKSALFRVQFL